MSYSLVVGDLEPDMAIDVINYNDGVGAPADLNDAADLTLRWKRPDGTVTEVPLVLVDPDAGSVKRVWVDGDTDQDGTHYGQVIVTYASGETRTYPNNGSYIIWNVYPQLEADE